MALLAALASARAEAADTTALAALFEDDEEVDEVADEEDVPEAGTMAVEDEDEAEGMGAGASKEAAVSS